MTGFHAIIALVVFVPTIMFIGKYILRRAGRTVVKNYPVVVMPPYPPFPAYPPPVGPSPAYPPTYQAQPSFLPPEQAPPGAASDMPVSDEQKFQEIVQDFYTR